MVFAPEDVIVTFMAVAVAVHTAHESGSLVTLSRTCAITPFFLVTMLMIASLHILYALIWFAPASFYTSASSFPLRLLGAYPVRVFANLVAIGKAAQQITVTLWALHAANAAALTSVSAGVSSLTALLSAADFRVWGTGLSLLLIGQLLNMGIYFAIGKDGVYYGFKLRRPVPWCTGFPFNIGFRHPQYVGAIISQLGVISMLASPATVAAGLPQLVAWWLICYALTSWMEASGDNEPKKDK
jgi:hypothetical protein|tara:strand:- start:608 stop:1333 length:726 start_codon:yes stop_codon:yes gene_type:complete